MINVKISAIFTTIKLTFSDIGFSIIKKMPLIYNFSVIIIGFYFKFQYKVICRQFI